VSIGKRDDGVKTILGSENFILVSRVLGELLSIMSSMGWDFGETFIINVGVSFGHFGWI
jgi:hypothetical protein